MTIPFKIFISFLIILSETFIFIEDISECIIICHTTGTKYFSSQDIVPLLDGAVLVHKGTVALIGTSAFLGKKASVMVIPTIHLWSVDSE